MRAGEGALNRAGGQTFDASRVNAYLFSMQTPPFGVPPRVPTDNIYEALRGDVSARLKNVCADWSEEDFNAIVEKVTRTAMKYLPARGPVAEDARE